MTVSGNDPIPDGMVDRMVDLARDAAEPLAPELEPYVEDSEMWGKMLRHPLVYMIPMTLPGTANRMLAQKKALIKRAIKDKDWHSVVFLHERPYRLWALIKFCCESDGVTDEVLPLSVQDAHVKEIAADVWVDSENIQQNIDTWRELMANGVGLWLGTEEERAEFDALPDLIPAYRGGAVGDWSWTTSRETAAFFSRQSGYPVRSALIRKDEVFGYLTRRQEYELLVRFTEERRHLIYPGGCDGSDDE